MCIVRVCRGVFGGCVLMYVCVVCGGCGCVWRALMCVV